MKVKAKLYKGIEYIQLSDLPEDQKELLPQTLNKSVFINILIDEKILSDCLQFRDYALWYESIFNPQPVKSKPAVTEGQSARVTQSAFDLKAK